MMDIPEMERSRALVETAITLLEEAETAWGQPLYYDEEGGYVEVVALLKHTAAQQRKIIKDEKA